MLGRKVAFGALWLVGSRIATKAMNLIAMLVVARLLTPADFGLVALAATVWLILDAITDLSLSEALIRMRAPPKSAYDTALTMNALRGLSLSAIMLAMALPFAELYGDPRLTELLLALAVCPVFKGLVSPRMADLARALRLKLVFALEVSAKAASFVASIAFAIATQSYWALIAGLIAAPTINCLVSYILAPYRPGISLSHWREIIRFSGWLALSQAIVTLNAHADRFFVGGHLGQADLGQYTVGTELATLPTQGPVLPITRALYVGFAKLADNLDQLRSAFLTSHLLVVALTLPLGLVVAVLAEPLILLTVGEDWLKAALVIQVVAPMAAIRVLAVTVQPMVMATGNTHLLARREALAFVLRLPIILTGLYAFGFEGLVWGRGLSIFVYLYLNLDLARSILGVSLFEQVSAPWRSLASGGALVGSLLVLAQAFPADRADSLSLLVHTASLSCVGFLVYGGVHLLLWRMTGYPSGPERRVLQLLRRASEPA